MTHLLQVDLSHCDEQFKRSRVILMKHLIFLIIKYNNVLNY